MSVRPERLAAAARAMQRTLLERLARDADQIAARLGADLGMVAWDREQLLGRTQRELIELRDRRFSKLGGEPVVVRELAAQPLECIVTAWERLRRGQRVVIVVESGASRAGLQLMHELGEALGEGVLRVAEGDDPPEDAREWSLVGVEPARPRVALIQVDADPELAAYVLARACLRRTGMDPRGVRHVVVPGPNEDVERHLRRLWVGARMGPPDDDGAFAGPVPASIAQGFVSGLAELEGDEAVEIVVNGDRLDRGVDGTYLAPALLAVEGATRPAPVPGPILVVHRCAAEEAEQVLDALSDPGGGQIRIGEGRRGLQMGPQDRQYAGALLLERIPPGLPKPRP